MVSVQQEQRLTRQLCRLMDKHSLQWRRYVLILNITTVIRPCITFLEFLEFLSLTLIAENFGLK